MVVNQKNLCLYSLLTHTQIFSIQHHLKHYFRNCFWAEPCNTLRQWKRGRWVSKGAGVKQSCSASLCFQLLHCTARATVNVTADWLSVLVHVGWARTVSAGKHNFSLLCFSRSILRRSLRWFTVLMGSLLRDLLNGQKQDCTKPTAHLMWANMLKILVL